jgi:diguanylate cyclase (GGDEF)-like protein/PAS domain S-box-containing protein
LIFSLKAKFIYIFIIIITILYGILYYEKDRRINEYLVNKTENFHIMYNTIFMEFQDEAKIIFDTVINKKEVLELYAKVGKSDDDILRDQLYDLLENRYQYYKRIKVKQLHFHTKENITFLRMHKPSIYSDNLSHYRQTVAYVNKNRKYIAGFEVGRVYSGMRFVFPLRYHEQYLGSVEVSFDITALLTKFMDSYKSHCNFHIKKEIINSKTWDEYIKKYYIQSPFEDYYIEKDVLSEIKKRTPNFIFEKKKMQDNIAMKIGLENVAKNKAISVYDIIVDRIVTFIPVQNPVSKEVVAFFTIRSEAEFVHKVYQDFYIFIVLLIVFTLLVLFLMYQIIINKNKLTKHLQKLVNEKTKELNDINKNLEDTIEKRTLELKKKRLKYKNLMSFSSDGIMILSRDNGQLVEFSNKVESLLGYSKNELLSLTVKDWDKSIKSDEEYKARASLITEIPSYFERIHTRKDGTIYHAGITAVKIEIEGEEYTYASVRDITEQKILQDVLGEQKFELETILNTTKDGIAILDLETNFLFSNNAYLQMTGFTKAELLNKSYIELSAKEDKKRVQIVIEEVIQKGSVENFQKTCVVKDSKRIMIDMSLALMPDKQRILISTKNITELKRKERQINEYVQLVDKNIITSTTDLEGNIIDVSEAFCNISGYSKKELIGQNHRIIKHPDNGDELYKNIWASLDNNKTWKGEIKNRKKDGRFYWVEATISPIFDEYGKKVGYTSIRQNITDKKLIEEISITDPLTTIYNRRYFNDLFPKIINSAKRNKELISFMMMDVDYFKQYNDTYGHQMGDQVLIKVAQSLQDSLHRADDYCFRLGGEEFGIIFRASTKEEAYKFAHKIRENIENLKIQHSNNSASDYISVSLGVITQRGDEIKDMNEIYKEADNQLYRAKEEGRNRVNTL